MLLTFNFLLAFCFINLQKIDKSSGSELAGLDLYFISSDDSSSQEDSNFKTTVLYRPYFYILQTVPDETLGAVLLQKYSGLLASAEWVDKIDLDQPNHLSPNASTRKVWKLSFDNTSHLMEVRKDLQDLIQQHNHSSDEDADDHHSGLELLQPTSTGSTSSTNHHQANPWSNIESLREYDVPYVVRVCMDLDIRAGSWFTVSVDSEGTSTLSNPDIETKANPTFLAFDIECTKAPLKFPNAMVDEIYMISFMVNTTSGPQGVLISSRTVVSQDIPDFEYTPKPTYPGPFQIYNEPNEKAVLQRFIEQVQYYKPQIISTYNGDSFDWPFLLQRARILKLDVWNELGFSLPYDHGKSDSKMMNNASTEITGRCIVHLDAFCWVQRDSYLPQGAQGLKAVTKYKLGYDPVEVDAEDMVPMAQEQPIHMATYSVSDAVATYYLYEKYVHLFIFSLCTLIPMGPSDVLRKGSGTLCEALLMVQACDKNIICPNKQVDPLTKFYKGKHLLESETYIGGKVECLETGVYRSDVEYDFDLVPSAFQHLIDQIDRDLCFAIEVEAGMDRGSIVNYEQVRSHIVEQLELLRDQPKRTERPYIYHLDVGAMYPNIILTNRLQPSAMVDDATCAACDFNSQKHGCKRPMEWIWRGDYSPSGKLEYDRTKDQLSREVLPDGRRFHDLSQKEQATLISTRLKQYSKTAYKKTKIQEEVVQTNTVCMRENDFYVDTVRRFRDRRYDYKKLTKVWKKRIDSAGSDRVAQKEAQDKALVYDSLQVAHKCILNSFYGYVMRKGARWRSMEMAGIVTKTGADLITQARQLVEQIGRPLELDTDGIWCILPKSFPDVYTFCTTDGSTIQLEYPCVMLNANVHDTFTNHQYQTLTDPKRGLYESRSENSIFFEVDGPYRAMILPASTEEGKLLKKRYAVFNFDGSLAELKGFELKRRGELELIKTFQSQVFERFLEGSTLKDCYDAVAEVANHWMDVIDTRGESLDDDELVDLISENRNMSRQLQDYGDQKGTSQTTARRLGEFLGAEIIQDKGLNCKFIIAEQPYGAPVTERAIPTAIWKAEPAIMKHYLRKWLKSPGLEGEALCDIRNILDWDYYRERLGKTIQKIITIPAALQKVENPVPRVAHPEWLHSKVQQLNNKFQQTSIKDMFGKAALAVKPTMMDIEDFGSKSSSSSSSSKRPVVHSRRRRGGSGANQLSIEAEEPAAPNQDQEAPDQQMVIQRANLSTTQNTTGAQFEDWLQQKKTLWRKHRRERRQEALRNELDGTGFGTTSKNGSKRQKRTAPISMEGFVKEAALNLSQREWQILEIRQVSSALDTTKNHKSNSSNASGGEFVVWALVGGDSLQKISLTVPRIVYVAAHQPLTLSTKNNSNKKDILEFKKVDKYLPHSQTAEFLYQVTLPEYVYRKTNWTSYLQAAVDGSPNDGDVTAIIQGVYETKTPLLVRALTQLGCVSKLNHHNSSQASSLKRSHMLSDLKRVDRPTEGMYLDPSVVSYKRCFLYVRTNPRTKTGLVALFVLHHGGTNSTTDNSSKNDVTAPTQAGVGNFDVSTACHIWIIKPGSSGGKSKSQKNGQQRNISLKQCESMFPSLLHTIQESADLESDYACVSAASTCEMASLSFVDREDAALSGANDVLQKNSTSNSGPMLVICNSSKPVPQLRRHMGSLHSLPTMPVPFPPGPDHNPSNSTLPALNWEPPAVQLCLEAYLYMTVVSFPQRVAYARYGNLPVGNLSEQDATCTVFDVSLSRLLHTNRALSWASPSSSSQPDLGCSAAAAVAASSEDASASVTTISQDDVWGDEDALVSPVIRRPGAYRNLCVDLDLQDLAIAALTDASVGVVMNSSSTSNSSNPEASSPTSVHQFDAAAAGNGNGWNAMLKSTAAAEPLGDELSTSTALPMIRALVSAWLRDALHSHSAVADTLLHHVYRLISNPDTLLHDPALHRVVHSWMKSTFLRLLGELQRLGCTIVYASFHRVTVSTHKTTLSDAEEYIQFVINTIRGYEDSPLARVSLRPRQFHTHHLFLDEYNYGTLQLERIPKDQVDPTTMEPQDIMVDDENENTVIVPSVVTAWSIMNYLGSEIAQGYFRIVAGRFSKDVLRKQLEYRQRDELKHNNIRSVFSKELNEQVVQYKKKMISKHFARDLTRAVGEIIQDTSNSDDQNRTSPPLMTPRSTPLNPVLEFIKSMIVVLQLDPDVDTDVHVLKRSLLNQVNVAEYSSLAKWENPCPTYILPDVFCAECQESRDINLCYVPPPDLPSVDEDNDAHPKQIHWFCEDCGTEYDVTDIERRLIQQVHTKLVRYQLQDIRCSKTKRVATRILAPVSDCSAPFELDIAQTKAKAELETLQQLAEYHELDELQRTTRGILNGFMN